MVDDTRCRTRGRAKPQASPSRHGRDFALAFQAFMAESMHALLERLYRSESGRIRATLIRLLGDFDGAEEALHDALRAALEQWPTEGIPANPAAWLVSVGRFKGIDRLRKNTRSDTPLEALRTAPEAPGADAFADLVEGSIPDDQLRLIFICCHPVLPADARAALTLREVCGLTTEEIARAFLSTPAATAQRIVRAKNKIRDDGLPYEVPSATELPARLGSVLQVIYLVFNEGYSASTGDALTRPDLSNEAIRLGRLLLGLLPEPEVMGLCALMLLQESRRTARVAQDGEVILLEQQDRSLWDRGFIAEGIALVEAALASGRAGPYALQAALAAVHAKAPTAAATDWTEMVALYDLLLRVHPSPVAELNRAIAVAMRDGPAAGLALMESLRGAGRLDDYHLLHSARADLYRRLGQTDEARAAYALAVTLTRQEPERRFLEKRLRELG
jgi:RNA polymerase sigma-70 factor (ECF subfamily)